MKSKKEIEQSARIYENYRSDSSELAQAESGGQYHGYKKGYNDCLKDNADKKYTLDDMKKACACGIDIVTAHDSEGNNFQPFEDFINSLNKQE